MTVWNLAIECSGIGGSIALENEQASSLLRVLPAVGGSVQHLAPAIASVLAQAGILRPDFLSVTVGPGSFTGLRVGIATVKMLAYVWQIPIVPVDTLHAIALHATSGDRKLHAATELLVVPVLNAFRKQVFSSVWRFSGNALAAVSRSQVLDAKAWMLDPIDSLCSTEVVRAGASGAKVLVAGPGLDNYQPNKSLDLALMPGGPDASAVAQVGWDGYSANLAVGPDLLNPNYIRQSAAEETRRSGAAG